MKIISFSLYGNDPNYNFGMVENAQSAEFIYPGWQIYVYIDKKVPADIMRKLIDLGCIIKYRDVSNHWHRFEPVFDCDVNICIVRDADSRFTYRERVAVNEWLESDKSLHTMHDHASHLNPIMGGMWGFRGTITNDDVVSKFYKEKELSESTKYGTDEIFLRSVYNLYKNDAMQHSVFKDNFTIDRVDGEFIGCQYRYKTIDDRLVRYRVSNFTKP